MKHEIEYQDDKILVNVEGGGYSFHRTHNDEKDNASIARIVEMLERESFYKSEHFINEFNEKLETAILATRQGGSGALACRDTLLSLYNGSAYKANLSNWYNLDKKNRAALLFVLEHQTANNRKDIDLYLPQYAADFTRMKSEVE
jgi:hypothetical protein